MDLGDLRAKKKKISFMQGRSTECTYPLHVREPVGIHASGADGTGAIGRSEELADETRGDVRREQGGFIRVRDILITKIVGF
jgi:hypothetical protein